MSYQSNYNAVLATQAAALQAAYDAAEVLDAAVAAASATLVETEPYSSAKNILGSFQATIASYKASLGSEIAKYPQT